MYTKNKEETEKHRKAKNIETAIEEEKNLIRNARKTARKCKERVNKNMRKQNQKEKRKKEVK